MYKGSSNSGDMIWFFQRITGLFLVILLLLHFLLIHLTNVDHETHMVTFDLVAKRLASPFWKTLDLVFLSMAVFHGLNGAWMVIADYIHQAWARITLFTITCTLGVILLALGVLTIVTFTGTV